MSIYGWLQTATRFPVLAWPLSSASNTKNYITNIIDDAVLEMHAHSVQETLKGTKMFKSINPLIGRVNIVQLHSGGNKFRDA